jgi:hypothetical protein
MDLQNKYRLEDAQTEPIFMQTIIGQNTPFVMWLDIKRRITKSEFLQEY